MKQLMLIFVTVFALLASPIASYAADVSYDLIPPQGQLSRGQEIQFIVEINTGGKSVTSSIVGMTYQSQYLQYLSTTPGDAMSSVSVDSNETGKLLFSGTNQAGFTGTGVFAYVNFKIIATAPGSAELCVLFVPTPTPTGAPVPTTKLPSVLPKTGDSDHVSMWTFLGFFLLLTSGGIYVSMRNGKFASIQSNTDQPTSRDKDRFRKT